MHNQVDGHRVCYPLPRTSPAATLRVDVGRHCTLHIMICRTGAEHCTLSPHGNGWLELGANSLTNSYNQPFSAYLRKIMDFSFHRPTTTAANYLLAGRHLKSSVWEMQNLVCETWVFGVRDFKKLG